MSELPAEERASGASRPDSHGVVVGTIEAITDFFGKISAWLVLPLIAVGFVHVILRYTGRVTSRTLTNNGVLEAQWYLYGTIFLLSFAYILKNQINVRVDFWFAGQPPKRKALIDIIGHFVGLIPFCVIGIWVSVGPILNSWRINEQSNAADGLPRAPIKSMILVALVLLSLQAIAEMIKLVRVLRGIETYDISESPTRVE